MAVVLVVIAEKITNGRSARSPWWRSEGGGPCSRRWWTFAESHARLKVLEPVPVASTTRVDEGRAGSQLGVVVPATEVVCAGIEACVDLQFADRLFGNARLVCGYLRFFPNQANIFTLFQRAEPIAITTTSTKRELFARFELSVVEEFAEPANAGTPILLEAAHILILEAPTLSQTLFFRFVSVGVSLAAAIREGGTGAILGVVVPGGRVLRARSRLHREVADINSSCDRALRSSWPSSFLAPRNDIMHLSATARMLTCSHRR